MKTLKLSTIATFLCLLCMSMGFPNLVSEEESDVDGCSRKKTRTTDVRTAALSCSRQVKIAHQPETDPKQQMKNEAADKVAAEVCEVPTADTCVVEKV